MLKAELELVEEKRKELKALILNLKNEEKEKIAEIKKEYFEKIYPLRAELNKVDFYICKNIFDK
jgi:hypothetical protein